MKAYLSNLAGKPLTEYLEKQGYELHFMTGANSPVYNAVKTHADIHMCRLGVWDNVDCFIGSPDKLTSHYPGNIIYNAICTNQYFIHNLKHTAPELLIAAGEWKSARSGSAKSWKGAPVSSSECSGSAELCNSSCGFSFVDVPQGYTRCCCLPVDDTSFITSDQGIAKALKAADADVLVIEKGHILLPGFDYGFIGGCAGHVWADQPADDDPSPDLPHAEAADTGISSKKKHRAIVFNGDLSAHPSFDAIETFIQDRNIDIVFFREYPLTDIGSILTAG